MTEATSGELLGRHVRSVCLDAMFVLASLHAANFEQLAKIAERRSEAWEAIRRGDRSDADDTEGWTVAMCTAMAPIAPPLWLPMRELLVHVTLEGGARGVRSLFTSKPSERQVLSAHSVGVAAVRLLAAVLGSDSEGQLDDEERILVSCLAHSLGLPKETAAGLGREIPLTPERVQIPSGLDVKVARMLVRGAWFAAFRDGLDAREEHSMSAVGRGMALGDEEVETIRREVREAADARKTLGAAVVDAVRYVLSDDPVDGPRLARIVASLALLPTHRAELLSAIDHAGPIVLAKRHALERPQRDVCLALCWFAALSSDPSQSRCAQLAVRHDSVATDLGPRGDGAVARDKAMRFLQEQTMRVVEQLGV